MYTLCLCPHQAEHNRMNGTLKAPWHTMINDKKRIVIYACPECLFPEGKFPIIGKLSEAQVEKLRADLTRAVGPPEHPIPTI